MLRYKPTYRFYVLSSLLLLATACNNNTPSVEKLIENDEQEALHQRRNEIQKEVQELEIKAQTIDDYFATQDGNQRMALVTIDTLKPTLFKHYIEVQGDLTTEENILIYSEVSGVIEQLPIKKGQSVTKGQVLAVVDDGGMQSQLAQLQSQESLAKTTFERQGRLWEENIGSEIQYLEAESTYNSAKSAVAQVKRQLNKSTIRAPFSGVVDELLVEQGQLSTPGQTPILRLVSLNNLYIDANIPENYLSAIKKDSEVEIHIRSINETFDAVVAQIGSHINPENRTFKARIQIPRKIDLARPNQIASIRVNDYTNEEAILIPNKILQVNSQGKSYINVYSKDDNDKAIAKRRMVEIGKSQGDMTEVLSGLKANDIILLDGAKSVRDGERIRLQN